MTRSIRRVVTSLCMLLFITVVLTFADFHVQASTTCWNCNGKGEVRCTNCGGYDRTCYLCHGSGSVTCRYCNGSGKLGADLGSRSSGSGSSGSGSSISISKKSLKLVAGRTASLKVSGTKKKVIWSSSNRSVATVSKGKVKAKKAGKATITAKVGSKKLKCTVTVRKKVYAKNIKFSRKSLQMIAGKSEKIKATISPKGVTEKYRIVWKSSNKKVAAVNNKGKVTAKSSGTAVITATVRGKKATCKIKVSTGKQILKKLVKKKGRLTNSNKSLTISYDASKHQYCFQRIEENVNMSMICNDSFTGNALISYYWHGRFTNSAVKGTARIPIATFGKNSNASFQFTTGSNSSLANSSLYVLLLNSDGLLKEKAGIGLRDLGFKAYK